MSSSGQALDTPDTNPAQVASSIPTDRAKVTRRRFTNSLTFRLVAVGIALIALGLIMRLLMVSYTLKDGIIEVAYTQQLALANLAAADIDRKVRAQRQLLETLARELPPALLDRPPQLEAWLAQRHALAPAFSLGLMVVPVSGKGAIADTPTMSARRQLDFSESDWFIAARDNTPFVIGKPRTGRVTQQPVVVMAVPFVNARGAVVAVIAGATGLDAPGFLDLIQNKSIGKSGGFLLVSPRDKIIIASSRLETHFQPTPIRGINLLLDRAMLGWRGTGIMVNLQDVEELTAVVSIPAASWFVVAHLPTAEALEPVSKMSALLVRDSLAITVVLVVALVAILSRTFRPLKQAAYQMRRMADGIEPLTPLVVVRQDEVGEMVEGFNYLLTKLRESEDRLTHIAHHDALTGLPNRLSFLDHLQQSLALARRHHTGLALIFIDLDGFKPINDRFGHETGDLLLKQFAHRLEGGVRQADTFARFGGDEFVLLLTDIPGREQAHQFADKLIAMLSAPYILNAIEVTVGASIGIAIFPQDAKDSNTLIARADAAMYEAKRAGGNCCRFAGPPA